MLEPADPWSAELNNLNFHPLEVVSRCRDPQLQAAENYWYLFNLRTKHLQILMFERLVLFLVIWLASKTV